MVKKKSILVVPLAGLGNRMRVLSSCIQIAKRDGRRLVIAWPVDTTLGCNLTDIFSDIGIEYSVLPKWLHFLIIRVFRHNAIRKYYKLYKVFSNIIFRSSIFDYDIERKLIPIDNKSSTLLVATCLSFEFKEEFSSFVFTPHLYNEVDTISYRINRPYIGVHIRRTDHIDSISHSPLNNYFFQMDKRVLLNPEQRFFLATDDEETKRLVREKYGGLVYFLDNRGGRRTSEGIFGAVIEMLLLSRSCEIICSITSSYSKTAILIGKVEKVVYADTFLQGNL